MSATADAFTEPGPTAWDVEKPGPQKIRVAEFGMGRTMSGYPSRLTSATNGSHEFSLSKAWEVV